MLSGEQFSREPFGPKIFVGVSSLRIKIHDILGGGETLRDRAATSERVRWGLYYVGMDRQEGVRNGPIRLSHLITTVATTHPLTLLTLLRRAPALLSDISTRNPSAALCAAKGQERLEGSRWFYQIYTPSRLTACLLPSLPPSSSLPPSTLALVALSPRPRHAWLPPRRCYVIACFPPVYHLIKFHSYAPLGHTSVNEKSFVEWNPSRKQTYRDW